MKKELSWSGYHATFLFDLESRNLYSYENDPVLVHHLYGGVNYYRSKSGLTGKVFIERGEVVLEVGWYRNDFKRTLIIRIQKEDPSFLIDEDPPQVEIISRREVVCNRGER